MAGKQFAQNANRRDNKNYRKADLPAIYPSNLFFTGAEHGVVYSLSEANFNGKKAKALGGKKP